MLIQLDSPYLNDRLSWIRANGQITRMCECEWKSKDCDGNVIKLHGWNIDYTVGKQGKHYLRHPHHQPLLAANHAYEADTGLHIPIDDIIREGAWADKPILDANGPKYSSIRKRMINTKAKKHRLEQRRKVRKLKQSWSDQP
jgi:hypothetical protein